MTDMTEFQQRAGAVAVGLPPEGHPLRRLGKGLASLLDDDQWNNCEPLLLGAWEEVQQLRKALTELMGYTPRREWKGGIETGGYVPAGAALIAVLDRCDAALTYHSNLNDRSDSDGLREKNTNQEDTDMPAATQQHTAHPIAATVAPAIGSPMAGGFYAGQIRIDGQLFALIVAPKGEGERDDIAWNGSYKNVAGAQSYYDGAANTKAMAEAGSELAQWAQQLNISGFNDWYLPSQDELEICYRNLKPTNDENWLYARSGINLSANEPTRPYTAEHPAQIAIEALQAAGEQAFESGWYWTSTQHAAYADYAWCQYFGDGYQYDYLKYDELRARAVRRLAI